MVENEAAELTHDTGRVGAYSDGVFAIVVTLLVLELHVPKIADQRNWADLLSALYTLGPKFLGFLMSFFFVTVFWVSHHQFFHTLRTSSRKLLWLNNLFLLFIIFIPFPTALLGEYPNNKTSVVLFGAVMFAASSSFALLRWYAWANDTITEEFERMSLRRVLNRGLFVPALSFAALAIALLSTQMAIALYLLAPIIYIIPVTLKSRGRNGEESSV